MVTAESFAKQVAEHQLTIVLDNGLHRHLKIEKPGTGCMGYELVTWPGYLAYSGDMGCFVFRRLDDMFEFFGSDLSKVNHGYWMEKLEAVDHPGGAREFCVERFREEVRGYLEDLDETYTAEQAQMIRHEVNEELLSPHFSSEWEAYQAVHDFSVDLDDDDGPFELSDFHEHRLTKPTHRMDWCLHAIVHGIALYRAQKGGAK